MSQPMQKNSAPTFGQSSWPEKRWDTDVERFDDEHSTNPYRQLDPLYALPATLLAAIRQELPAWLAPDEIKFETDLARLCARHHAVGIFHGRDVAYPLINRPENTQLEGLFRRPEVDWSKHLDLEQFRKSLRVGFGNLDPLVEQSIGYIGWLLSNPMFLSERDRLRDRSSQIVKKLGAIPKYLKTTRKEKPLRNDGKEIRAKFDNAFNTFFSRWQLEGFATWDLPRPCGANLTGHDVPSDRPPSVARLSFELPSTIRLPSHYPIQNAIEVIQRDKAPDHLADWIAVQDQEDRDGLR